MFAVGKGTVIEMATKEAVTLVHNKSQWSLQSEESRLQAQQVMKNLGLVAQEPPDSPHSKEVLYDTLFKPSSTACNQCGMCCKAFFLPMTPEMLLEAQRVWKEWKETSSGDRSKLPGRENFLLEFKVAYPQNDGTVEHYNERFWFGRYNLKTEKWLMEGCYPLSDEQRKEMEPEIKERSTAVGRDWFGCHFLDESGELAHCTIHDSEEYPDVCARYRPTSDDGYLGGPGALAHKKCSYHSHNWHMSRLYHAKLGEHSRFAQGRISLEDVVKGHQESAVESLRNSRLLLNE